MEDISHLIILKKNVSGYDSQSSLRHIYYPGCGMQNNESTRVNSLGPIY